VTNRTTDPARGSLVLKEPLNQISAAAHTRFSTPRMLPEAHMCVPIFSFVFVISLTQLTRSRLHTADWWIGNDLAWSCPSPSETLSPLLPERLRETRNRYFGRRSNWEPPEYKHRALAMPVSLIGCFFAPLSRVGRQLYALWWTDIPLRVFHKISKTGITIMVKLSLCLTN
jgi:hypothetical protein